MKFFVFLSFAFALSLVAADEKEDCKCQPGFEAKQNKEGEWRCAGKLLKIIEPCNLPRSPQCKCTGGANGIVTDASGVHCSISENGVEKKRWDCDNKEEFEEFYKQNPDFKPQPTL